MYIYLVSVPMNWGKANCHVIWNIRWEGLIKQTSSCKTAAFRCAFPDLFWMVFCRKELDGSWSIHSLAPYGTVKFSWNHMLDVTAKRGQSPPAFLAFLLKLFITTICYCNVIWWHTSIYVSKWNSPLKPIKSWCVSNSGSYNELHFPGITSGSLAFLSAFSSLAAAFQMTE